MSQPSTQEALDAIHLRTVQHASVARMLRPIFIGIAERACSASELNAEWANDLSEGLAVVAEYVERDCDDVSTHTDRLRAITSTGRNAR
jgi:hypothetical protein